MSRHSHARNGSPPLLVALRTPLPPKHSGTDLGQPVLVSLSSLVPADSPRLQGLNAAHAEALAEVDQELPPILVQRSTKQVIDGMHRVGAARLRGQDKILAQFFDGGKDEAFLLAVTTNIKHGLPLTLADRRAAAARIIRLRPDVSDRWIADVAGLAAKTVAAIRQRVTGSGPGLARRIGRDGRVRPTSAAAGRRMASEILASNPDASLRQIARAAGISVGTARDVRERVRKGIDPVLPPKHLSQENRQAGPVKPRKASSQVDFKTVLQRLRQDPSVRYTESGRTVLRWLRPPRLLSNSDWESVADCIPPHCTFDVIRIARSCATAWDSFADELERRCAAV